MTPMDERIGNVQKNLSPCKKCGEMPDLEWFCLGVSCHFEIRNHKECGIWVGGFNLNDRAERGNIDEMAKTWEERNNNVEVSL